MTEEKPDPRNIISRDNFRCTEATNLDKNMI